MDNKPELSKLKKHLAMESNIEFVDISFDTNTGKWKEYLKSKNPNGLQLISKNNHETSRKVKKILKF